jgi:5-methylcytosine-specific restriction protein A
MITPARQPRKWELKRETTQKWGKEPLYKTYKWRKLRNTFIAQHPLCVACELDGVVKPAYVVDHVQPISKGGAPFDYNNLQSLCEMHHNRKSSSERVGG